MSAGLFGLHRVSAVLGLAFTVFALSSVSSSALTDCTAARETISPAQPNQPVFKVVLDEITMEVQELDSQTLHQVLRAKVQDNVDKMKREYSEIHAVFCSGRKPANESDINNEVIGFANNGVVLEIWGLFDGEEAIFTQAVIPLLKEYPADWPAVDRYYRDTYPYNGNEGVLVFLKRAVGESVRLRTYAAVGVASRSLVTKDFDRARRYFCDALGKIGEIPNADSDTTLTSLKAFVSRMAISSVELAIVAAREGHYNGPLASGEVSSGQPCVD